MKNTQTAKDIRESLKTQPAYLNILPVRARVFDAKAKRDGTLSVRILVGNGRLAWLTVRPDQTVSIYSGTAMEEVLTGDSRPLPATVPALQGFGKGRTDYGIASIGNGIYVRTGRRK